MFDDPDQTPKHAMYIVLTLRGLLPDLAMAQLARLNDQRRTKEQDPITLEDYLSTLLGIAITQKALEQEKNNHA